ncbi:MAG: transporter permease [Rhodoglobus sp.]|jgi:ABC-2 type transport system permease protein|nr:transporter permease [Rhodoglobus sp.]
MIAIAVSELRMLVRNRLVATLGILSPLVIGGIFILNRPPEGGLAFAATLQIATMLGLGVYVTGTTTLAARRQNLFLKRLRSSAASDPAIIAGLIAPIILVGLLQVAIIMTGLAVSASALPVHGWLLVPVVLLVDVMFAGFAVATAGVTNSPEHAQFTTLPLFFVTVGVTFWVTLTGTQDLGLVKQALPLGAIPELMGIVWYDGDLSRVPLLLIPTIAWTVVALVAAKAMFRWEPRS